MQQIIKNTGSKRSLSEKIASYFPENIETMIEPFAGSAAVSFFMMSKNYNVKEYIINDTNISLIEFYKEIKLDYSGLTKDYSSMHKNFNKPYAIKEDLYKNRKEVFNKLRDEYNKTKNVSIYNFLTRTSANGLIRFNKKGEFNAPCHFSRPGISPESLDKIFNYYHELINRNNVDFYSLDYKEFLNYFTKTQNFCFLDPPYINTNKSMYFGDFKNDDFEKFLTNIKRFCLTYDGNSDLKFNYIELHSKSSSFRRIFSMDDKKVFEKMYMKGF